MKLYDPARPKVGDRPALLWEGKVVGAVPAISFMPHEVSGFVAEVCIVTAPSTGKWLYVSTTSSDELLHNYRTDPEHVLQSTFGWHYEGTRKRMENRSAFKIGDLGELE